MKDELKEWTYIPIFPGAKPHQVKEIREKNEEIKKKNEEIKKKNEEIKAYNDQIQFQQKIERERKQKEQRIAEQAFFKEQLRLEKERLLAEQEKKRIEAEEKKERIRLRQEKEKERKEKEIELEEIGEEWKELQRQIRLLFKTPREYKKWQSAKSEFQLDMDLMVTKDPKQAYFQLLKDLFLLKKLLEVKCNTLSKHIEDASEQFQHQRSVTETTATLLFEEVDRSYNELVAQYKRHKTKELYDQVNQSFQRLKEVIETNQYNLMLMERDYLYWETVIGDHKSLLNKIKVLDEKINAILDELPVKKLEEFEKFKKTMAKKSY